MKFIAKKPVVHYADSQDTACGVYICGEAYYVGQEENNAYYHPLIQHTAVKDLVTCKKCQKTAKCKAIEVLP